MWPQHGLLEVETQRRVILGEHGKEGGAASVPELQVTSSVVEIVSDQEREREDKGLNYHFSPGDAAVILISGFR